MSGFRAWGFPFISSVFLQHLLKYPRCFLSSSWNNRMGSAPHKVKDFAPLHHFPPKYSKSEPAACSKARIESPARGDSSGTSWLYNQKTAAGWAVVINAGSGHSHKNKKVKRFGETNQNIFASRLHGWVKRCEEVGLPTNLALIALATLALNCLTHGKHRSSSKKKSASKGRKHGTHCGWEEKNCKKGTRRGWVGKL